MKPGHRFRCGFRALVDLAVHGVGRPVTIRTMAARINMPEHCLRTLFGILTRESLVKGLRGGRGGYVLARSPEIITGDEVFRILAGMETPVDCLWMEMDSAAEAGCEAGKETWAEMDRVVRRMLKKMTLADMARWIRQADADREAATRSVADSQATI